jgi:Skp family chaperone for outer membrane proteins
MNNRIVIAVLAASLLGITACSSKAPDSDSGIGIVDVQRVTSNWPKFLNYQNQLNSDMQALQASKESNAEKQRDLAGLTARFQSSQSELTSDVRNAAQQVATDKHLHAVLTRQYVGYGGVDITPDVEKALQITEKTPAP